MAVLSLRASPISRPPPQLHRARNPELKLSRSRFVSNPPLPGQISGIPGVSSFWLQCRSKTRGNLVRLGQISCVLGSDGAPQVDSSPSSLPSHRIWLSDVIARPPGPSNLLLGRKWGSRDCIHLGFLALVHGFCLLAPFTFTWGAFGSFVALYVTTGLFGITLSYHRNLSHKSFKLPKWLEYTFAYCGAQAMQGDPISWVSSHRYHHQHCDTASDPHTPLQGFWHSHMGWLLDNQAFLDKVGEPSNVGDLRGDAFYRFLERTYPIHPVVLAGILYAIGGVPYVVWGMAVRIVWVYHITWAVNSAAHVWGSQQWNTGDLSRNNWWVALLAFGEGWHNNHHAFEYSARHGLEWWQFDMTWYVVRSLQALGLATKVKLPSHEQRVKLAM
ncbi:palmitoyl-monogalactosyldiacylglycerol delta-7 desaturase, chloroplastic [Selaginella moellendorffii]|nr:palmitoyl-monogalactosyldiacylglycerol delta-7 desaturase, chloroplastic [Selaginella moellendorffii]|eukprot:XP_002993364.2 palmitoyl-monogalactosyldiacylglycerol delta-7 desaturase, chloroplastic [Selaginella moellendorffii]